MKFYVNLYANTNFNYKGSWNHAHAAIYFDKETAKEQYELINQPGLVNCPSTGYARPFIGTFEIDVRKKKTVWVNMYREGDMLFTGGDVYNTKEEAEEESRNNGFYHLGSFPIEIEV